MKTSAHEANQGARESRDQKQLREAACACVCRVVILSRWDDDGLPLKNLGAFVARTFEFNRVKF